MEPMEHEPLSLVIFTQELTYSCTINSKGPRKFGTLSQLINIKEKNRSTVGNTTNDERHLLLDIRNSYNYTSIIKFNIDETIIIDNLKKITPYEKHNNLIWTELNKYTIIEYLQGGFFTKHIDKKINKRHYGTLLIFPPAINDFEHTGGELIITINKDNIFKFESSKNKDWTFIAFNINLEHECKEVISGKRIIIKHSLMYDNDFYDEDKNNIIPIDKVQKCD